MIIARDNKYFIKTKKEIIKHTWKLDVKHCTKLSLVNHYFLSIVQQLDVELTENRLLEPLMHCVAENHHRSDLCRFKCLNTLGVNIKYASDKNRENFKQMLSSQQWREWCLDSPKDLHIYFKDLESYHSYDTNHYLDINTSIISTRQQQQLLIDYLFGEESNLQTIVVQAYSNALPKVKRRIRIALLDLNYTFKNNSQMQQQAKQATKEGWFTGFNQIDQLFIIPNGCINQTLTDKYESLLKKECSTLCSDDTELRFDTPTFKYEFDYGECVFTTDDFQEINDESQHIGMTEEEWNEIVNSQFDD
ncbi:hypothetical protein PPL_02370 [Heterostelium album PN500]|uniref:Uncharacterized protein n=1 Tax=Heterostelium pallidum (strain ATCC 26659 / Pp 5 / PN500) TaxID=670386 RepID=D3AZI8_HETP5|nr:hypothetical protein PPL_02370 [Heterostelium album PN500]EFA85367.1 hypothetical protein PPL_02370 [Heterostelium album PN500]|eukprot:XP_020437476.1 hypothetical protein PPL_02370 [Heterostelium album PN500]